MVKSETIETKAEPDSFTDLDEAFRKHPWMTSSKSSRSSHFYTLTASNLEEPELIIEEHCTEQYLVERKAELKAQGYRVSTIEESNLTGNVVRTPDKIPDYITNKVSEQPRPNLSDIPLPKIHKQSEYSSAQTERIRQRTFDRQNAKSRRKAEKYQSIPIYEKRTGKLCFSGSLNDAVKFIVNRVESGVWTNDDWVIYVPQKIYDYLMERVTNANS